MILNLGTINPSWFITAVVSYLCFVTPSILAQDSSAQQWSPNMEIFEIIPSPDNATEQIRPVPKRKNSEIIVGEDVGPQSRLVIKCNATFPVQIVYIGAGRPEFTTFTNVQWREDPQKPLTFEAEASLGLLGFQGTLRTEDTGNYSCRSIQNATIHSYFYIYVPGPSLFTSPDDYNSELYFTPRDKTIWIPCTAAHPSAIVSLHKTSSGRLECPAIGKSLATYDPHKGFLLQLKDPSLKRPEGVYLCIGSQNENFRMMEYKLIATNSNHSENGKHPCRPSPCGQKAECSVLDGHPICYCFRGLSGNPYGECSVNKDRCHSNAECSPGKFCVMGKCTNDPCQPTPCGKGSTCFSQGGRPRCGCQIGHDGKPPFCLRKCQFHGDCPQEEICSRSHCQDPCPGHCGTGAECQVIQTGRFNRTVLCLCPPGTTGDPEENCYDIGAEPGGGPQIHCPLGFIGPGPPNCRRKECSENYDCPPNHYCTADKRCVDHSGPGGGDKCGHICGINAVCQLGRSLTSSAKPVCACPNWATGDPLVRCFNLTNTAKPVDGSQTHCPPGFIGPGPPNCRKKECSENYDCPPNHYCTADKQCIDQRGSGGGDRCGNICGMNAVCQLGRSGSSSSKPVCSCPSWATGDPFVRCFNLTTTTTPTNATAVPYPPRPQDPCDLDPCPRGSVCRVKRIYGQIFVDVNDVTCECPSGRSGKPPNCYPVLTQEHERPRPTDPPSHQLQCFEDPDCPPGFECVGRLCFPEDVPQTSPQCRRLCGLNAQCVSGKCVCRDKLVGDPHIACRAERTPCNPSPCANFAECRETHGKAACRCILGYEGDAFTRCAPSHGEKYPDSAEGRDRDRDRPQGKDWPSFKPGFVDVENYAHHRFSGPSATKPSYPEENNFPNRPRHPQQPPSSHKGSNPSLNSRPESRPSNRRDECDMARKDDCGPPDYQCRRGKDGVAKCVCSSHRCGYSPEQRPSGIPDGVIYGRYCSVNEDCRFPEICSNLTLNCYNPCSFENSPCAHVAFSECRVLEGQALCTCRRGYVGNPASGLDCRRDFGVSEALNSVSTSGSNTVPVVQCDFEKEIGCDNRSECRLVEGRGQCVCGLGLVGDYPDCRLRCKINRDCFNAHECWREECRDPCERNPCGNNAFCRVIDHTPTCSCNPGTKGDAWVGCIPNPADNNKQKGFLLKCEGNACNFF